jgi:glycogen(starch) synthase
MKVLMVTREFPPFVVGGIATHTFHLSRALINLGVDVKVVSFGNPKRSSDAVTFIQPKSSIISSSKQVMGRDLAILYDIARFRRILNKMIAKEGFDIVHVQEPYVGGHIKAETKITTIQTTSYGELSSMAASSAGLHEIERVLFYVGVGFIMEHASLASSKVIITVAPAIRDELVHKYRVGREKIIIIMNGVESKNEYSSLSRNEAKRIIQADPSKILLFAASRHIARKRFDLLLKAISMAEAKDLLTKVEVRIGGDGPLRPYLESLVETLGIRSRVKFLGWLSGDAMALHCKASDIFVSSSDYEGSPLAILEAMISGAAVVSTNIPGYPVPTQATDDVNILLTPPRDAVALANAIRALITDQNLRDRISKSGKAFALQHTWDKIADRTLRVYEASLRT